MTDWLPLYRDTKIAVSAAHRFGADALLLADFAAARPGEAVVELGTGCGAIALRLCAAARPGAVLGIDADPQAIALCHRSAAAFDGPVQPEFRVADWAQPKTIAPAGTARLVVCNPPFFPPNSGKASADEARRRARHASAETLSQVCAAGRWLLQNGGRFCLCHRPEQLATVLAAMTAAGLEPKRLRPVQQRPTTAPWLFLVEGRRGGRPGLRWEAPLCLEEADGAPSAEQKRIYNL